MHYASGTTHKGERIEVLTMGYMESTLRPAVILAITLPLCYYIGKAYDAPVEGLVAGFVVNGLLNGMIDYSLAQPPSSSL